MKPAVDHGHRLVHPYVSMVDRDFMGVARAHDLEVNVWTGDDETEDTIRDLVALGVDGIITSNPRRALSIVG